MTHEEGLRDALAQAFKIGPYISRGDEQLESLPPDILRSCLTRALNPTEEDLRELTQEKETKQKVRQIQHDTEAALADIREKHTPNALPEYFTQLVWYHTEDKLPSEGQRVLIRVCDPEVHYEVGRFQCSQMLPNEPLPYSWANGPCRYYGHKVTHWAEI